MDRFNDLLMDRLDNQTPRVAARFDNAPPFQGTTDIDQDEQ